MSAPLGPPRFSRRLLERVVPADVREGVCGDLAEVFHRDCAAHGAAAARRAYRRKARSFARHFAVERVRDAAHNLLSARVSRLDFKLGVRMLLRYPGLSIIGGLSMAFAIAIGAAVFAFIGNFFIPTVPLPDGDRLIAIRLYDEAKTDIELRSAFDLARWRARARTVEHVSALRTLDRNLVSPDGLGEPVAVAEMTASTFAMTRVAPLLGRALAESDEPVGAPAVVVLSHATWTTRFKADSAVVGSVVRLGAEPTTVVGVMPEGFRFPIAQEAWTPLRLPQPADGPRQGPAIRVFARLADGATLDTARSEFATISAQTAGEFPSTHQRLRAELKTIPDAATNMDALERMAFFSVNVFIFMLLVLVSGNVALLMFARAATRESELLVRSALGASRGRIIAQFFAEALVLGGVAAAAGIAIASSGLKWGMRTFQIAALGDNERLPFWISDRLEPWTIAYAVGLTLCASLIAGVVPALKITRGLQSRLRQATAGGGGLKFGGIWTVVIVSQVAVTVAFPVTSFLVRRDEMQMRGVDIGLPTHQYVTARLEMDREGNAAPFTPETRQEFAAAYNRRVRSLAERLAAEGGIVSVTTAERLPLMYHPYRRIDVDDGGAAPADAQFGGFRVTAVGVDEQFLNAFAAPAIDGRAFSAADFAGGRRVAVVNQSFVHLVFGDRNPIGRRIRYAEIEEWDAPRANQPWFEIIGVVRDLGLGVPPDTRVAGFYMPSTVESAYPMQLAIRVSGDAGAVMRRLRAIVTKAEPAFRLYDVNTLDQANARDLQAMAFWFRLTIGISVVALVLSLAGIYAVMSFTVSRRTREIGIRVALGADAMRVVLSTLRRPLIQVALGILAGAGLTTFLISLVYDGSLETSHLALIAAYALFMMAVCLLACIVPTMRALRVQPTDALRTGE